MGTTGIRGSWDETAPKARINIRKMKFFKWALLSFLFASNLIIIWKKAVP